MVVRGTPQRGRGERTNRASEPARRIAVIPSLHRARTLRESRQGEVPSAMCARKGPPGELGSPEHLSGGPQPYEEAGLPGSPKPPLLAPPAPSRTCPHSSAPVRTRSRPFAPVPTSSLARRLAHPDARDSFGAGATVRSPPGGLSRLTGNPRLVVTTRHDRPRRRGSIRPASGRRKPTRSERARARRSSHGLDSFRRAAPRFQRGEATVKVPSITAPTTTPNRSSGCTCSRCRTRPSRGTRSSSSARHPPPRRP